MVSFYGAQYFIGFYGGEYFKGKSYQFAIRIVKLYKHIVSEKSEYVLSKQILRSGTSIGANVEEAGQGQSKADFVHKLSIAQKKHLKRIIG